MAASALPGLGHPRDAQLLGSERSNDGADSDGYASEERTMLGGALLISQFGAGRLSLDARRSFIR